MSRLIPVSYDLLIELEQFLDDRADIADGDYGEPRPNKAMQLHRDVEALLDADERADDGWWALAKSLVRR